MKIALVYDRVNKWGGAERVLLALHELFPNAPLYTSVYDKSAAPWADVFDIKTSFLQKIPFARSRHEFLAAFMPFAFGKFNFDKYDLVISVTSEAAKGIKTGKNTKHICYCLTPTRYLWSGYDEYFTSKFFKFLTYPLVWVLRNLDLRSANKPDKYVAISKEVQKRIRRYYQRESDVVYPPVTLGKKNALRTNPNPSPYYLIVSRLSKFTRYKKVDLAVKAANKLGISLKVVGDGNLKKDLEGMAGPTVAFLGRLSDKKLSEYYKNCRALIFPGFEDLGLVMIEAQTFGRPVVAYGKGGALELVNKKTGILFENQTIDSLVRAIKKFEKIDFDSADCIENAKRFDMQNFKKDFLAVVNELF